MRLFFLLTGFVLFTTGYSQTNNDAKKFYDETMKRQKAQIGKPFPPFSATDHYTLITNKSWLGKTVYLNFWFEACAPCVAEMNALNKLYEKLKDSSAFQFVSITFESPQRVEELRSQYGMSYPCISLSKQECQRLSFGSGYPAHIVLDGKGIVAHLSSGGPTDKDQAERKVMNELLPVILNTSAKANN